MLRHHSHGFNNDILNLETSVPTKPTIEKPDVKDSPTADKATTNKDDSQKSPDTKQESKAPAPVSHA